MGGEYRTVQVSGRTFSEAWKREQDIERQEKGDDYYNGSICNVDDVRKVSDKEYNDTVNNDSGHNIHKCSGIMKVIREPKGNTNKIKTEVERFANKGTRKWTTKYVVYEDWTLSQKKSFNLQADAIAHARKLTEKTCNPHNVEIEKHLDGPTRVAQTKYKKSSTERDGTWEVYCLVPW
jgi:hypothetical protein